MGYLNSGIGAARINDSSPSDYTTYSGNKIETKQDSTDNTLTTTSKTIVGAINEVNSKVNNKFIVAQTLPVSDIDEFAIYLVPKSTAQTNNIYDEYIYISTDTPAHWEKIGDTEIDLSGYYTSSQVDNLLDDKQDATDNSLITTDKTIVGAINELHAINGYSYDAYDATTAYSKDDLCIYNNVLYKALQATKGNLPTNTTYWEQTSIADEIGRIDTALSGKQDDLTFITLTIDGSDLATTQIPNGTIRDIFYNLDISSKLPTGKKVKMFTVATSNPTAVIARQWISGDNKISVSLGNLTTTTITITSITIQCLCI